jgi:gluconate 2-dehydrogenase
MIGHTQIAMMKPSAILINTSRGEVIDEEALIQALLQNKIAGAGLDVFDPEPPNCENPLLHMENVVTTPHIGGAVSENWIPRVNITWENLENVWKGKAPYNVVRYHGC